MRSSIARGRSWAPRRLGVASVAAVFVVTSACNLARADDVEIVMSADRTSVGVGETFTLEIRVDVQGARPNDLRLPDLSAFEVIARQRSQPMQLSFGFGGGSRTVHSSTIEVLTLRARTPGRFEIRPASVRVAGREHRSDPLTIHVGQGSATRPTPAPPPAPPAGASALAGDPEAFLRADVDKTDPYVGEQVTLTLHLYTREPLGSSPNLRRDISTDGFWMHDLLPDTRNITPYQQILEGQPYYVYLLRKTAVFPVRSGELSLGSAEVAVVVGSVFDFFRRPRELVRESNPVTIRARELPEEARLAAVGQFRLSAKLDRNQVRTGEAATLTVTVDGIGNLQDVHLELPQLEGVRALTPEIDDQVESPDDIVGGRRTYRWILLAEAPGKLTIPPFGFDVFDPRGGERRSVRTEALSLERVGAAKPSAGAAAPARGGRQDAEVLGPLRSQASLRRVQAPVASHLWFALGLAAPPLTFVLGWLLALLRDRRDEHSRRFRGSARATHRQLAEARAFAEAGQARSLYSALTQLLTTSIERQLGEPLGALTHDALARRLAERGMPEGLAETVVETLEGYDFARFSTAGSDATEMRDAIDRATEILDRVSRFTPTDGTQR